MQDPLYREIILEHWQNPQNYGVIKNPDIDVSEINIICGDKIRLTGKIKNKKLAEVAFTGDGCAISKASSSLFSEKIKGMTLAGIKKINKEEVIKNLPVSITPARHSCALLCFRALQKGLYPAPQRPARQSVGLMKIREAKYLMPRPASQRGEP